MGKPANKTNSIIMTTFWSSPSVDRFDFQTLILENVALLVSMCLPFPKGKANSFFCCCCFSPLNWLTALYVMVEDMRITVTSLH